VDFRRDVNNLGYTLAQVDNEYNPTIIDSDETNAFGSRNDRGVIRVVVLLDGCRVGLVRVIDESEVVYSRNGREIQYFKADATFNSDLGRLNYVDRAPTSPEPQTLLGYLHDSRLLSRCRKANF